MKPEEVVTDALPAAAAKVGWIGALLASLGALSLTEWMAIGGFLVALIGSLGSLALNAFFRYRRDRREQEAYERHAAREQAIYDAHAAEILARTNTKLPEPPLPDDND